MNVNNYRYLKSKVSDFFCIENMRTIYEDDSYDFRVSFLDFLMCIEDFYTFVYSPKLSKNSWLLFTWLRTLVRYDGYVRLSYKDVSSKFNDGKSQMMSKPTFFKCISELESYGLVKRIANKKFYNSKYQNDTNTYIVISKIETILPLLDGMKTQSEFYNILRKEFFDFDKKEIVKKAKPKENWNKISFEVCQKEYESIWQTIEDFFTFLGSANKSGKIAKSRQTNILNVIYNIDPYYNDLTYAIGQTISKGVKNEKYLYAILRNIYNEEKSDDGSSEETQVETQLKKKYTQKKKSFVNGLSDEQYKSFARMIYAKRSGWKKVLQELKKLGIIDCSSNGEHETRLLNACNKLKRKEEILKEASYIRGDRMNILEKYGIEEHIRYSKTFSELIHWQYESGGVVDITKIKELRNKYPNEFKLNGAQFIDEEIYNEQDW